MPPLEVDELEVLASAPPLLVEEDVEDEDVDVEVVPLLPLLLPLLPPNKSGEVAPLQAATTRPTKQSKSGSRRERMDKSSSD